MKDFFQYITGNLIASIFSAGSLVGNRKARIKNLRSITLFILLTVGCLQTYAQVVFPVQVNQSILPPYNTTLNSYVTSTNVKLRLYLTLTDVNVSNRQVRLKLRIQGEGLDLRSTDFVTGATPIFLNGGIQLQFTNVDLAPYFQLNNLLGISPQQYNQPLPDGSYKICWEVYDFLTGQRISAPNMGCSSIFLLLNAPPFLNLPNNGDQLTDVQPTNIIFQWTPRHANATNVSYEFELRELWDNNMDPQAGFLASPPYHTETTFSTSLLYNISKPLLMPGRSYAWRVRAKSTTELSENSVFRNNGHSEILYFTYTSQCFPPTFTLAEPLGKERVKISWQTHPDHNKYHVQYKRSDIPDAQWFEVFSYNDQVQIANLQDGVTYSFRVGGTCHELTDLDQAYSYSGINQFTTPTTDEKVSYNCGIVPEIAIGNTDPLGNIGVNETFTAGDFPVTVKQIQGGNGRFSGTGFIVVPYLADTKIAVEFSGIQINTDYQLIDGIIKTNYDPNWGNTYDLGAELETLEDLITEIEEAINDAHQDGSLSDGERDAALAAVDQFTGDLAQAQETLQQGEAEIAEGKALSTDSDKAEESEELIASGTEKVEIAQTTTEELKERLQEKAAEYGVSPDPEGEPQQDDYFDVLLPITANGEGEIPVGLLDGEGTLSIKVNTDDPLPTIEPRTFTIEGNAYTVYITSSTSSTADIELARNGVENPSYGIAIYLHYDTDKGELGYKVEMSRAYFGDLDDDEFEWSRQAFKDGIKNMIRDIQNVEDWSAELLEITEGINRRIKQLLDVAKVPEEFWNPDDPVYYEVPIHWEPMGAGLIDGALEEVAGIAQLVSLVIDYNTNPEVKQQIDQTWEDLDTDAVIAYAEKFVEDRSQLYETGTYHQIEYQSGKDAVAIATAVTGVGVAVKTLKESTEFVKDLVTLVKKNINNVEGDLLSSLKTKLGNKLDDIQWQEFETDFVDDVDLLKKFDGNPELIDSWKKFGNSPLRTNTKFLEHFNDFPASWKITHNGGVTKVLDGNGKELAELSEGLIKTKGGTKANGDWNKLLNKPPMKNQKYQIDDYLFETDELGRVKNVKGELQNVERGRLNSQQTVSVALKDGVTGDEGGHLIANILNGPGEQLNYLPQTRTLNNGAWKEMETLWKNAIRKTPSPSKVEVDIRPIFEGTSKRPVAFEVDYWIDGVKKSEFFDN